MGYEECDAEAEEREQAAYEAVGPQWAEDHADALFNEAVEEFTKQRLNAYYVDRPHIQDPAVASLRYALTLQSEHPTASLVFAVTTIEFILIEVILKPLVFGLVHTEGMEKIVVEAAIRKGSNGVKILKDLLSPLLKEYAGLDWMNFRRNNGKSVLYKEIYDSQQSRNQVLHEGKTATPEEANLAICVADFLLNEVYPQLKRRIR